MADDTKHNNPEALPAQFRSRMGKIRPRKGLDKSKLKRLMSWDVYPKCTGVQCPAAIMCDHVIEEEVEHCKVAASYLRATAEMFFNNFITVLDEPRLYILGMHLMPLYRTLCRIKIEELGVTKIVATTDRGTKVANPIYREKRETIKAITALWKELGLMDYMVVWEEPSMEGINPDPVGDSYYDRLEAGNVKTKQELAEEEKKTMRGEKKGKVMKLLLRKDIRQ